jgi:hypothetical protein
VWWSFLLIVSALNIVLLLCLRARYRRNAFGTRDGAFAIEPLMRSRSALLEDVLRTLRLGRPLTRPVNE